MFAHFQKHKQFVWALDKGLLVEILLLHSQYALFLLLFRWNVIFYIIFHKFKC